MVSSHDNYNLALNLLTTTVWRSNEQYPNNHLDCVKPRQGKNLVNLKAKKVVQPTTDQY